jgi:hypothetical protein
VIIIIIGKLCDNGEYEHVARTKHVSRNVNPTWQPIKTTLMNLCDGDYSRPLLVQVYDWDPSEKQPELIAQTEIESAQQLISQVQQTFTLKSPFDTTTTMTTTIESQLIVNSVEINKQDSFVDYIRGGFQLELMYAIDFSSSNGVPNTTFSLHNRSDDQNAYLKVIELISNTVCPYSGGKSKNEQEVHMFGFGTTLSDQTESDSSGGSLVLLGSNFEDSRIVVENSASVVGAYKSVLQSAPFSEQMNHTESYKCFAPVLRSCLDVVEKYNDPKKYAVIVLITNGDFSDTRQTLQQLVRASTLPVSIIIVGLDDQNSATNTNSNYQFEKLMGYFSDKNNRFLQDMNGNYAQRDVVTFAKLSTDQISNIESSKLLSEIPDQFLQYQRIRSMRPTIKKIQSNPSQKSNANVRLKST